MQREEVSLVQRWDGIKSKYCEEYENFFKNIQKPDLAYYVERLKDNGIEYNPSKKQR